jgi:E3 ubiquitin-protein ligase HUWE1
LTVDSNNLIKSSLAAISKCDMHKEVKIGFQGDKVLDAGGLMREWLFLLFKELTHPHLGSLSTLFLFF